jgi:hypothetical protein
LILRASDTIENGFPTCFASKRADNIRVASRAAYMESRGGTSLSRWD